MSPRTATELMHQFWHAQRSRGEKPRVVHGLVSRGNPADQPAGYVTAWGVSRKYVEMIHERRTEPEKSGWEIREFYPEQVVQ